MRQKFITTMSDTPPMQRLLVIFNLRTILIALASVATTWLCIRYQITASFPMTMIVAAIVFPLAFSINSAYERRENALDHYASLKTESRSIYCASRDWQTEASPESLAHLRELLRDILDHTIALLTDPRVNVERNESHANSFRHIIVFISQYTGSARGSI